MPRRVSTKLHLHAYCTIMPSYDRLLPGLLLGTVLGYTLRWWLHRKLEEAPHTATEVGEGREGNYSSARRLRQRAPESGEECKMVLVVNSSLKMRAGKIGAQCAHAAVGVLEELDEEDEELLEQWEESGQAKVCLKAADEEELLALAAEAEAAGLAAYQVQDQGRTQVAYGSRTVLAIGPGPCSQIDRITGHLKLL